jgi:hypothetical protein
MRKRLALRLKGRAEVLHRPGKFAVAQENAQPEGGRIDVVGGLRQVDVVVGMQVFVLSLFVAHQLQSAVGDHLVGVHVGGGAGTPLDHVDGELVVPLSGDHLVASR